MLSDPRFLAYNKFKLVLPERDRDVLLCIACWKDPDGPTSEQICKQLNLRISTVSGCLARLNKKGMTKHNGMAVQSSGYDAYRHVINT